MTHRTTNATKRRRRRRGGTHTERRRFNAYCYGGRDLTAREANLGRRSEALEWHIVARDSEGYECIAELPGADEEEAIAVAHEWMREHPGGR